MKTENPDDIWGIDIFQCYEHPAETPMEPDGSIACENCAGEVAARSKVIDRLRQSAATISAEVQSHGLPPMPPTFEMQARLEVLLDSLFHDPRQRLKYEGEVGRRLINAIKEMRSMVEQPVLHTPQREGLTVVRDRGSVRRPIKDYPQA